jgi:hypothetical protein
MVRIPKDAIDPIDEVNSAITLCIRGNLWTKKWTRRDMPKTKLRREIALLLRRVDLKARIEAFEHCTRYAHPDFESILRKGLRKLRAKLADLGEES